MKTAKSNLHYWIFGSAAALLVGALVIKQFKKQTMISKLIPFIERWEGGLSRALTDTASSNPAPWTHKGKKGWHTNKGITYSTFISLSKKIGYAVTPHNFFKMSEQLWLKILMEGYMKPYPLHRIKHLPRIQAVIITWAWGSGLGGSERRLANFQREIMGIIDGDITKSEIVENFKRYITKVNERKWFNLLCDRRAEDFTKMSTFSANGRGWLRRLADFRESFG